MGQNRNRFRCFQVGLHLFQTACCDTPGARWSALLFFDFSVVVFFYDSLNVSTVRDEEVLEYCTCTMTEMAGRVHTCAHKPNVA